MSIEVMSLVWKVFPASGSELLTMLALADWCNDDGGSLHPSMRKIAEKVRLTECQARRIMHKLELSGYVNVVGNQNGGAPGMTRQYQINVPRLRQLPQEILTTSAESTPVLSATPVLDATPSAGARRPLAPVRETPSAGASQSTIEPPIEPPIKKRGEKKPALDSIDLPNWLSIDSWLAFVEHRKSIKKAMSLRAAELIIKELAKIKAAGFDPEAEIDRSIMNGWQGIFMPKGVVANATHKPSLTGAAARNSAVSTAIRNLCSREAGQSEDGGTGDIRNTAGGDANQVLDHVPN